MVNTIPFDTFAEMGSLKKLSLGFNRISFIGKNSFFGLDHLHSLNLEYNALVDLLGKLKINFKLNFGLNIFWDEKL